MKFQSINILQYNPSRWEGSGDARVTIPQQVHKVLAVNLKVISNSTMRIIKENGHLVPQGLQD